MTPADDLEAARRRRDDPVTYRELVDYTSRALEDFTRSRSETLLQLEARMNGLGATLEGRLQAISAQLEEHNRWHRDELSGQLARGPSVRIAAISAVFAFAATLVAVVTLLGGKP